MVDPDTWGALGDYRVVAAAAGLVAVVAVGWVVLRRVTLPPVAVLVAAVAAAACTAYSADTSWRFAGHRLGMHSSVERGAMFGAAELALMATALMARQNLRGPNKAPGVPGMLVWGITGVQIIPAYSESGAVGGTVRAVIGPILAALLWHLAMGIELRHARPDALSHSLLAIIGREVRERSLSRLGLATRGRDADQISRDRATDRAVRYAARLASSPAGRTARWTERRLAKAVARARIGSDDTQRARLMADLAARRNATSLATIPISAPWQHPAPDAVPAPVLPASTAPSTGEYTPPPVLDSPPEPAATDASTLLAPTDRHPATEPPVLGGEVHPEYTIPLVPDQAADEELVDTSPPPPAEDDLTAQARGDFPHGTPSIREIKERYRVGQARATRIRDELTRVLA